MPQKTNLNVAPYYDDFDVSKNFYKILFRPGYSIQGRELTQVQSILQNQVESFGRHAFKQGELVIPGEVGLNTKLDYVKLSSVSEVAINDGNGIVYRKYDIRELVGQQLVGLTSGVIGTVLSANIATETTSDTVYVKYVNSGNSNNETTFRQGETLEVVDGVNTPLLVVGTDGSVLPTSIAITDPDTKQVSSIESPAMGFASAVKVEEGIYFVNGFFVRNDSQLLVIDEYYDKPTAKVGFTIVENIVTPEEDQSLYDNARGSSNFTAPGAHRLQIELNLKEFGFDEITDKNFIQLLTVKRGAIQKKVTPADYSLLEQTLARRTFDESGDYVVDNFGIDIREYQQKDGNNGIYSVDEFGKYNGRESEEASRLMLAAVGPGKAYIKGYEIVNKETKYIEVAKARESLNTDNVTLKTRGLPTFNITNVFGSVPLNAEAPELTAYPDVFLYSTFNDGSLGFNDTEDANAHRQTLSRRGLKFSPSDAIKTITIEVQSTSDPNLGSITDGTFENVIGELWFVKSRSTSGAPAVVSSVKSISYAKINRPEINPTTSVKFLELTICGNKDDIISLVEYDEGDPNFIRKLFKSEADAKADGSYFGEILDYSNTITPLIGKVKPNNFKFLKRGAGFNTDTDVVLSKGRLAGGVSSYNSVFGFSFFDPTYFTKIITQSPIASVTAFNAGQYVYGLESGAYGVVEGPADGLYTTKNVLFLKVLFGSFKSGETIADESGNTLKIAKDNTISHFVVLKRGQGYTDDFTISLNGVEYDNSKVQLKVTSGGKIYGCSIVNFNSVSDTYSQPPLVSVNQPEGADQPSSNAVIAAVLVRNAVTTYNASAVKSFSAQYGSGNANTFTADVEVDDQSYADITDVTQFTFSGSQGYKFLESNSFSADASSLLLQGDVIQFTDVDNNTIRAIVQYATKPIGTSKTRVYLDTALPADVTNNSIVRIRPKVANQNQGTLLFPTGSNEIESIVRDTEDSKIKYYIRRDFVTATTVQDNITFAAQLPFGTQRFTAFTEENYIVTVLDPGDAPNIVAGDIVYIPADAVEITSATEGTTGLTSGSINIFLSKDYFGFIAENGAYPKLKLTATLEVDKAKPRLKTAIRRKRIVVISSGDRVVPFRGRDFDSDSIDQKSYADAFKLRYVYEGTSTSPPEVDTAGNLVAGTDITARFTFDDGQRDTIYDVSRIVLKPGAEPPAGQLVIAFDYFEHSAGDFCTVDSYIHEAGVDSNEIPIFNSNVLGVTKLKNVIDFRPKVDNEAIVSGFQDTSILERTEGSFSRSGAVISASPAPDSNLEYTFSFSQVQYLSRIDALFLTNKGEFVVKEGNSSLNPSKPDPLNDAVPLYYMYIPAYTETSKDVRITPVDNRRYTMRDIGKLEKRIERLEYYTTLSILEQQALNMQVKDNVGLDRFKSGFFVDNFETHRGNLSSLDHQSAVDTQQSVLRAQSKEDSILLEEVYNREDQRSVAGYSRKGDIVTLPYENLELLGNAFATKTVNPNPFVVLQYVGDGELSPPVDQWYDTSIAPLVVDNNTNIFSIFLAKEDVEEAYSSLYNSFVINWVGSAPVFENINSLGTINTEAVRSTVDLASTQSSSNVSPVNNTVGKGIQQKQVGGNVVSNSLQFFARSIPVKYVIRRLKPNTKVYAFLEGRDVSRWVNPDQRFTGIAGNSLSSFNGDIVTDENGNASGIILIPAGLPPRENSSWSGKIEDVDYDTSAEEVRITTGIKTIRFTSSSENIGKESVDTYAEVKFYASGILPENPSSIISTRPSYFKSNEGVQLVNSNTDNPLKPNPMAQTFKIENFDGGVFTTGVDLFFSKKSENIPCKVYLTNVESGKPGKNIVPGTEKTLTPYTYLKVFGSGNISLYKGESLVGQRSSASGPIVKIYDKNNVELVATASGKYSLTNEQVYTVVLSNHNGKSFIANEGLVSETLTLDNAKNNTDLTLQIAKDSGRVTRLKVKATGGNYSSAIAVIESPQLPGGSTATARLDVSGGRIYNAELSLSGFGYTEAPSVVIKGVGNGAAGCEIESFITIDVPAVRMGIATDNEGVTESTTPTNFEFEYPVYLENEAEYALVIETDSTDYELWASRLGETEIATSTTVTTQPSLGSVFRSQNVDNWTEDIFEDVKFTLYRAEFDISRRAELLLTNQPLGYELVEADVFQTNASAKSNADSTLFGNNNNILKINHHNHGFEDSGKSYAFYKNADEVGGISASTLNSNLFQVSNSGIDTYTIFSASKASSNALGGTNVLAAYNRKYESLYPQIRYISSTGTKIETDVITTNIQPVDAITSNYESYSQTEYERTFLNETHFFTNQKVIASPINQTMNGIERSLTYKMNLSSTVSYLSPVVDLGVASLKTSTNRVENASGQENRFGRRDQILEFLPVYSFTVSNTTGTTITTGQTVIGHETKAVGTIVKVVNDTIFVKVSTNNYYSLRDGLKFGDQTALNPDSSIVNPTLAQHPIKVNSNPVQQFFDIPDASPIIARNPSTPSQVYENTIDGNTVNWNRRDNKLTVRVDRRPINDDFNGRIIDNSSFNRNADVNEQGFDIFRVGDVISYQGQAEDEQEFLEVASVGYTNGTQFIEENTSKNSSAVAKYVTKEIAISNPATGINVHLTANTKDIANIEVLYKFKKSASQENFEDIEWIYFNGNGQPDVFEIASSENTISGISEKQSSYQELVYSANDVEEFASFAVKIVMKSPDPAYVPKIQDIRAVASF